MQYVPDNSCDDLASYRYRDECCPTVFALPQNVLGRLLDSEGVSDEVEQAANENWTARLGKFKTSAADDAEGYAKFQLLTNGITYTIIFDGIMKEYNSGNTEGGNTIVDTSEVGYDVTTYKLTFEEFNVETNRFQAVAYQTIGQYGETDHAMTFLGAMSYKAFCRQRYGSNVIGGDVTKVDGAETYISREDRGVTSISSATAVVTTKYLEPFTSYRLYGYLHSRVSSGKRYYCVDFVGDFDALLHKLLLQVNSKLESLVEQLQSHQ